LNYIFAFSPNEVVDVTLRYSTNKEETLKRRKKFDEKWLEECLELRRSRMWKMEAAEERELLEARYKKEQLDLAKAGRRCHGDPTKYLPTEKDIKVYRDSVKEAMLNQ